MHAEGAGDGTTTEPIRMYLTPASSLDPSHGSVTAYIELMFVGQNAPQPRFSPGKAWATVADTARSMPAATARPTNREARVLIPHPPLPPRDETRAAAGPALGVGGTRRARRDRRPDQPGADVHEDAAPNCFGSKLVTGLPVQALHLAPRCLVGRGRARAVRAGGSLPGDELALAAGGDVDVAARRAGRLVKDDLVEHEADRVLAGLGDVFRRRVSRVDARLVIRVDIRNE